MYCGEIVLKFMSVLALLAVIVFIVVMYFRHPPSQGVLQVGVLPHQNEANQRKIYAPLLNYLNNVTGIKAELVVPSSYANLIQLFEQGKIDLALLGGVTFLQAHAKAGAIPLIMRGVDTRFTSWFLVKSESPINSIHDLKNKIFSFGSKLSTSGHLMPRHFMKHSMQLVPEDHFSNVLYSGAHDLTAQWILNGTVDAGAANSTIVKSMIKDGRLQANALRVLWETPPYTDYVWCVSKDLPAAVKIQIRDAFLQLDVENVNHREVLTNLQATEYYPASIDDFIQLQAIVAPLGILADE